MLCQQLAQNNGTGSSVSGDLQAAQVAGRNKRMACRIKPGSL